MDWQPIETAPRDGSALLISSTSHYIPTTAHYSGKWRRGFKGGAPIPFEPTHWMPLPEKPHKWFDDDGKTKTRLVSLGISPKNGQEYYTWEQREDGKPWINAGMVGPEEWFGGLTDEEKKWARVNGERKNK